MTQQQIDLATFFFAFLVVIGLWAVFNLYIQRSRLWQCSVLFAMLLGGIGGVAIFLPDLRPYNGLIRVVGFAGVVLGAYFSGYATTTEAATVAVKRTSLWALGIGVIALVLFMPALYTIQKQGDEAARQTATLQVLETQTIQLNEKVGRLEEANLKLTARLDAEAATRKEGEAAFQKQVLTNQKKGLQNQADVKAKLQKTQPPQRTIYIERGRNKTSYDLPDSSRWNPYIFGHNER